MGLRRIALCWIAVIVVGAASVASASAASAATGSGYGKWTLSGGGGAYSGTVTLPTGFPAVSFTSDSRAAANLAVSARQPATSPFGSVFGASTGEQYVSLRPAGGAGTTSTTTYTFATPTPATTWGFALGDIDAELLTISGLDSAGAPVSATDLGFQSAGNALGGPPTLTATPAAALYTVEDVQCPVDIERCDTDGATAWFRPSVPLSALTVTSTYKSGAPVYQTWFATIVRAISGTVTAPPDATFTAPPVVELRDDDGIVATTPVASDGSYLFDGLAARPDYSVVVDPVSLPTGLAGGPAVAVDTLAADVTGADVSIETAAAPPPPPPPPAPPAPPVTVPATPAAATLPATGIDSSTEVGQLQQFAVALLLVGSGTLLTVAGRRRRTSR